MVKSAEQIVALFAGHHDLSSSPTGGGGDGSGCSGSSSMDAILRDARDTLEAVWSTNQQTEVEKIAQKIADAARSGECLFVFFFSLPFPLLFLSLP